MTQLALYIDDKTASKMDRAAKRDGKSRSAWVKEAIIEKIQKGLPESWFALWGTWEDDRSVDEILKDIDGGYANAVERPALK